MSETHTLGYEKFIITDMGTTDIDPKFFLGHDYEFSEKDKEKLKNMKLLTANEIKKEKLTQYFIDRKNQILKYNPTEYKE